MSGFGGFNINQDSWDQQKKSGVALSDDTNRGDVYGGMQGLYAQELREKEEREKNKPLTKWDRKMNRIFGEATHLRKNFQMGFMMGGLVGCVMGGLSGTYFAIQYR